MTWADRNAMQLDRLHHAIRASRTPQSNTSTQGEKRDLPCRDYNGMTGCNAPRSHPGRNVNFVHVCSMCFAVGDRQYHPAYACPRRQPGPQQPTANNRPIYQSTPIPTAPKNGVPASHQSQGMVRPIATDYLTQ